MKYDAETKTYKQAEKITQTEADKIFHQVEKQKSVFDDMVDISEVEDDYLDGKLPF